MKRPAGVTILAGLVLLIGGFNLIRLVQTVKNWEFLSRLLPFSPFYFVISGFVWIIISFIILFGISRRKPWTILLIISSSAGYTIYYWMDRLLLVDKASRIGNDLFVLLVNIMIMVIILWIVSRCKVRDYFGVAYEQ